MIVTVEVKATSLTTTPMWWREERRWDATAVGETAVAIVTGEEPHPLGWSSRFVRLPVKQGDAGWEVLPAERERFILYRDKHSMQVRRDQVCRDGEAWVNVYEVLYSYDGAGRGVVVDELRKYSIEQKILSEHPGPRYPELHEMSREEFSERRRELRSMLPRRVAKRHALRERRERELLVLRLREEFKSSSVLHRAACQREVEEAWEAEKAAFLATWADKIDHIVDH